MLETMSDTTKRPVVYLLCGLAGSGKSTFAQELVEAGVQKLSLDEEVYNRHGRAGVDYPAQDYLQLYGKVKIDLDNELMELLEQKQSVVTGCRARLLLRRMVRFAPLLA